MKKKTVMLILTLFIIIITTIGISFYINERAEKRKVFSINDYSYYTETFASDIKTQEINNRKEAKKSQKRLLRKIIFKA